MSSQHFPALSDDEDAFMNAPSRAASPIDVEPPKKRRRTDHTDNLDSGNSENEADNEIEVQGEQTQRRKQPQQLNQNLVALATSIGKDARLLAEDVEYLKEFAQDSSNVRELKTCALLLSVRSELHKIVVERPVFKIDKDLKANLQGAARKILMRSNITHYRGEAIVQSLLKDLDAFGIVIPAGVRKNQTDWRVVTAEARDAFTQARAALKAVIKESFKSENSEDQSDIVTLTDALLKGTNVLRTVALCGRVALMRAVYCKDSTTDFWATLDKKLDSIRKKANGDKKKVRKYFAGILDQDRETYGVSESYELGSYDVNAGSESDEA